jgi:hypothetical protein
MNWVILLIIGLAGLALVVAGFVYVGLKAWRLAKRGARVSRDVAPLADELSRQAAVLSEAADRLAGRSDELSANLARLQASMARLQVVAQAFSDAVAPYRRARSYLAGN